MGRKREIIYKYSFLIRSNEGYYGYFSCGSLLKSVIYLTMLADEGFKLETLSVSGDILKGIILFPKHPCPLIEITKMLI